MNLHIVMHQRVWRTFLLINSFVVIRSCHAASDLPMADTTSFSPVMKEISAGNTTTTATTIRMRGLEFSDCESERIVIEENIGPADNSGVPRIHYLRSRRSGNRGSLRDVSYNTEEKFELLRLHNLYRSNVTPPAADMKYMEWDESLADMALEWAEHLSSIEGCPLKHGLPASKKNYEGSVGQNLYSGGDRNGTRALYLWYEEYKDYNFSTLECVPGKMCGHYTQMVWGNSVKVGCNVASCLSRPGKYMVVCHYNPAGNYAGNHPYSVGIPCSQCATPDGGLCYKNQCVTKSLCKLENLPCRCTLKCHNCGYLNKGTCRCECKKGWDSLDCSQPCRDIDRLCGKSPGYPSKDYCYLNERLVERKFCRQMCGQCQPAVEDKEHNDLVGTCCWGKMCPPGEVLFTHEAFCSCHKLCPGPGCERGSGNRLYRVDTLSLLPFSIFMIKILLQTEFSR